MILQIKLAALIILLCLTDFAQAQVKFRVKKLNADSLALLIPEKEGAELVEVLNLLSNVICREDMDSSLSLANKAIELSGKLDYEKGLADGYFNKGNVYFLIDSLQPTISNYLKALRIYEDLEPSQEYGNLCIQLSFINFRTGRFDSEKDYGRDALHIYEKINDKEGQYMVYAGMATVKHLVYHDWDSAIYYANKALLYLDPEHDHNEAAIVHNEIGLIYHLHYLNSGDSALLTRAFASFTKALELPELFDGVRARIYLNLGATYITVNTDESISTGIEYFLKVDSIGKYSYDAYDFKPIIKNLLAWLSYNKGDYESAAGLFKQSIDIIEERLNTFSINDYREPILGFNAIFHHKMYKEASYQGLYNTYSEMGDYKQALEYYALSRDAGQEIYTDKNQKLITLLESISKDEKAEQQLGILARDNQLKALTIKQSRTYLFALAVFILILVLVALLFLRQRKIRAEHKIFVREQKLLHDLELKNMESKKLKELDHLKSQFFANISHEFRTPLTLIMGPLNKVIAQSEDKNHQQELNIAKKYAGKLQVLINNLLSISKLESGKMELRTSETNIVKLVGTYIQSFESLAKQKNIELQFTSDNNEIQAFIDREKFEQVLNNLLSNAFKFTEDGGVIEVAVGRMYLAAGNGQCVELSISDTGCGIPPEHLQHIFDRFYQVGQEDNSQYEGTGIGLALTKELVELHQGEISVASEAGKGTSFTITIPLGRAHLKDEEIADQNEKSNIEQAIGNGQLTGGIEQDTIGSKQDKVGIRQQAENQSILLIVEDNADMRFYIRGYFEGEYSIIEAVDGLDGYEKSTRYVPDIIISDVMMPNMDGNEFCEKIKTDERTSHIPLILLTARASKESRMEGLETGANDFITKPFDGDELQVRVRNLIQQRKQIIAVLEKKFQKNQIEAIVDFKDIGITSMDDKFLQKAKELVDKNLSNPNYSISDFTSDMAFSRVQLHRKLKALIGISSTEFIRTIRLNYAKGLLQKKSGTISEIAYDVGFNNPTYFSEMFKRKFGMSPSEFQNNFK